MSESAIHNERTKLTATYLNGAALAVFAVGGLAPLAAGLYGNAGSAQGVVPALFGFFGCTAVSLALHLAGRFALGRMKQ